MSLRDLPSLLKCGPLHAVDRALVGAFVALLPIKRVEFLERVSALETGLDPTYGVSKEITGTSLHVFLHVS